MHCRGWLLYFMSIHNYNLITNFTIHITKKDLTSRINRYSIVFVCLFVYIFFWYDNLSFISLNMIRMVRKTTAKIKDAAQHWYDSFIQHDWSFADVISKIIETIQDYWMTILWLVLLLLGLIQLSEILIGVVLVITGLLFVGWFFKDPEQK